MLQRVPCNKFPQEPVAPRFATFLQVIKHSKLVHSFFEIGMITCKVIIESYRRRSYLSHGEFRIIFLDRNFAREEQGQGYGVWSPTKDYRYLDVAH